MSKHNLHIDIETYSSIDLKKRGAHNYAQHPDTRLLLFAFALDDEPVQIIDYAQGEYIPSYVIQALNDPTITKHAFNAPFEITVLSRFFDNLPIDQWHCTMFHAQYCGLPASLENVSKVLVDPEQQKITEGKALIRYFSQPCKPTKANGGRRRNLPLHAPEKWHLFKEYCRRDVEAERAIFKKLEAFTPPSQEQADWLLDRQINNQGILIDKAFVEGAIYYKRQLEQVLFEQAQQLTGLSNPKSANQLKAWLEKQEGVKIESIAKNNILETEKKLTTSKAKKALRLRNEMTKTSNKKYIVMRSLMACDQRIKESMQFYGANRTGRWAGRGVQVQNLPRTYLENMAEQREAIKNRQADKLDSDTLSQLIRTAFIAPKNQQLVVSDFSAIEARVIAWLSKETWRMNVFATHGKIYEASASQMFGVPIEKITKGNPEYVLRQKGKVAELALGYQGSVNALIAMGALAGGLSEQELPQIVVRWRQASPHIVDLWRTTERSALHAIKNKCATQGARGIKFNFETSRELSFLTVRLPSGRKLFYANAYIAKGRFGNPAIFYQSMNQVTRKWETTQTYGGKLVENIVQAIARDCLMESLRKIATKYKIVMHVHDEVVIEAKKGEQALNDLIAIMSEPIDWAQGLVLRADGFVDDFYRKE